VQSDKGGKSVDLTIYGLDSRCGTVDENDRRLPQKFESPRPRDSKSLNVFEDFLKGKAGFVFFLLEDKKNDRMNESICWTQTQSPRYGPRLWEISATFSSVDHISKYRHKFGSVSSF
jgi:hypothetical protein